MNQRDFAKEFMVAHGGIRVLTTSLAAFPDGTILGTHGLETARKVWDHPEVWVAANVAV